MGNNPKTSVLNKYCQAHEVKNLFVTDAAAFVTNPDKNPTLTIMALSWRASEYLMDQAKKRKFVGRENMAITPYRAETYSNVGHGGDG